MKSLKFFNVKTKKTFKTSKYTVKKIRTSKGIRWVAVTNQDNTTVWRFIAH